MTTTITVLEGDQTGQELLECALRVLDPAACGVELNLRRFDLSLSNRRATNNTVVFAAADAMKECEPAEGFPGLPRSPESARPSA
jgi:isocitrate/isopropylmalate dehydrogenase